MFATAVCVCLSATLASQTVGERIDPTPPERVSVLPVFFVPTDQRPPTSGQTWRIHLHAGPSKTVAVRGLQFFNDAGEISSPMVPCDELRSLK